MDDDDDDDEDFEADGEGEDAMHEQILGHLIKRHLNSLLGSFQFDMASECLAQEIGNEFICFLDFRSFFGFSRSWSW